MERLTKKNDGAPGYYMACSENCAKDGAKLRGSLAIPHKEAHHAIH